MSKDGTEFSKYAHVFREVIDGNKTNFDILTKDLLKMGLTDIDKAYIDDEYPTYNDEKGERHFEGNKGDVLRKYYGGTNDLSNLIPKLETEFDEEFRERYCEELQDYDEAKIKKFAQILKIDVNENSIDIVSEAIAEYYASIVIGSATKKSRKGKKVKDELESNRNKIVLSYTTTKDEKEALVNLCKSINASLGTLEHETRTIFDRQLELDKLTDSEADNRWKPHLEYKIELAIKSYNNAYLKIQDLFSDLTKLLEPKKDMEASFTAILSTVNSIQHDDFTMICPKEFNYNNFNLMISRLKNNIAWALRVINKH